MPPLNLRRSVIAGLAIAFFALIVIISSHPDSSTVRSYIPAWSNKHHTQDPQVQFTLDQCSSPDPFEKLFGRTNIRLSRAYEGSLARLHRFVDRALHGEDLKIGIIGGSVTKGHGVYESERWSTILDQWWKEFFPSATITTTNGAAPATGSDYFSFCFPLHIPEDSDLVFVELAVNDEALLEHVEDMEMLIRGLLELPHKPAVVLLEIVAFSNGGMGGGGGRMHLPVAQYYDVPVINQRLPLAAHFERFPKLHHHYFAKDWYGNTDSRHINARGHRDVARLIGSLIRDTTCNIVIDSTSTTQSNNDIVENTPQTPVYGDQLKSLYGADMEEALKHHELFWPEETHSWRMTEKIKEEGDEAKGENASEPKEVEVWYPGMWSRPPEFGSIPRQLVLDGWNPNLDHVVAPVKPICHSTRATDAQFNLTSTYSEGWSWWVHPEHQDKPYIVATKPGSKIVFELSTSVGVIKLYSLRSKTFGLGRVRCHVDDKVDAAVVVDGWWDKGDLNIGRFSTIGEHLEPGNHKVTCELLEETSDAEGRTEFRIISLMSM